MGTTAMQRFQRANVRTITVAATACAAIVFCSANTFACNESSPTFDCRDIPASAQSNVSTGEIIDPANFFQLVVDRYRTLSSYQDTMHVVEVTHQDGKEVQRRETDVRCEITDEGELRVRTPGAMLRDELGLGVPFSHTKSMEETRRRLDLWLAPHLGLRYLENPLHDFREGIEKGFTAKSAKAVKVNDRSMVQIELASDDDVDDTKDGEDASFDLYIDPESMLVERIEGRQQLDDGSISRTTVEISVGDVRNERGEVIRTARTTQSEGEGTTGPAQVAEPMNPATRGPVGENESSSPPAQPTAPNGGTPIPAGEKFSPGV